MLDLKSRHVSRLFADLAADAETKTTKEPLGYCKEGKRSTICGRLPQAS
jgi:hypothetical protein